jgi:hypothetical protein
MKQKTEIRYMITRKKKMQVGRGQKKPERAERSVRRRKMEYKKTGGNRRRNKGRKP